MTSATVKGPAQPEGSAVSVSPFAVFRNRNFALLWTGELVSTIGSSLTSLAASILVYRLTNSALSVGLMLMATAAPSLVLGLIAGVFVDRFDRKRIMIISDIICGLLVLAIPFLVPVNIIWLYIIVLFESSIIQFFTPAHAATLPDVASDTELAAANSLMAISSFGSTAVGFAASGLIASQFPIEWAFYIDAATFFVSALCIAMISLPYTAPEGKTDVATVFRNMRSGFDFLVKTPVLRSLLILLPWVFLSFGLWNTMLLPFALQALQATEFEYGLQEGLTSIGFVVGSLLMAKVAGSLREGQWLTVSLLAMAILNAIYSQMTWIPLAIVFVTISGFANAPASIARSLIVQRNTPREMRGRVNSVFAVARSVAFLIGMAAAGLADLWGVRTLALSSAVLVFIPGLLTLVLPGLAQPVDEWRRAVGLLRAAPAAPSLGAARSATLADFDSLAVRLPILASLPPRERRTLVSQAQVMDIPTGNAIVRHGEQDDHVYFILSGSAVAGIETGGDYQSLEIMRPGDFFGEIAALMGTPRTANVVAAEPVTLFQLGAGAFRNLIQDPALSSLVHRKFAERVARTNLSEMPRFSGVDPQTLRELRQPAQG